MKRAGSYLLLFTLVAMTAILAPRGAWGRGAVVGLPLDVCIARVLPGDTPARMVAAPSGRFDCAAPQTRLGAGDYWVLSAPIAATDTARRDHARIASIWQDRVTLYALYPNGKISGWRYDGAAMSRNLQLGGIVQWALPPERGTPARLLWRVDGSANLRGILLAPTLATSRQAVDANLSMAALYAGFGGLCIALLIYNLAMWGALRHRFQLAYCGMVFALLLYAYSSSGALAWMFPEVGNNDRLRINYALLALALISAIVFARTFFPQTVAAGWVGKASNAVIALALVAVFAIVVLAPWHMRWLDLVYSLSMVAAIAIAVPIIVRAWRQRSRHLWLFATAWAFPIAFGLARLLGNLAVVQWNFWLDNSTILSMAFEAVISTLAIAYRIRLIAIERDEAIEREVIAARLADTDPLTGLMNRRAFLRRAIGSEAEQALILTDLDHFKTVNETLGHDGGDEVLRIFARVLRQSAPEGALIARMGGEEFAMLCPIDRAPAPEVVLERLRASRMPFDLTVTTSIGACTGPIATEADWKAMYRNADRALFDAKQAGRDRARFARAA